MGSEQRVSLPIDGIVMGENVLDNLYLWSTITGLGKPETTAGDRPRPRDDGEFFGRDRVRGRLVTIEGSVNTYDAGSCMAAWRRLLRAWDAPGYRGVSGQVMPLQMEAFGGDPVSVFGRPRNIDPKDDPGMSLVEQGVIEFVATFQAVDHLFYGAEQSTAVGLVAQARSGFTWPITWPITWSTASASRPGLVDVDGDADAYLAATIYGPIVRPTIDVLGLFTITLDLTLAYDRYVTISAAPWSRGVWLDGVTNVSGALTTTSRRLAKARLPPGPQEVALRGTDPTGTARATVSWRPATRSI